MVVYGNNFINIESKNFDSERTILMTNFKKAMAMSCAAIMTISAMGMSVFASSNETKAAEKVAVEAGYTVIENMIDYSVYDEDMVYLQEHADKAAAYNVALKARATIGSYSAWDWSSDGVYSCTTRSAAGLTISYYFTPANNYLYFNAEVRGLSEAPYLAVNKLNANGSLTYVGSYYVTSSGDNTYEWSNYKRTLSAGQNYVFGLWCDDGKWSYAGLDIYKAAM